MNKLHYRIKPMKSEITCEKGKGICRKKCRQSEVELHYCFENNQLCCVDSSSTIISYVKEEFKIEYTTSSQPSY